MNNSVAIVVRFDLCISCGACHFVCPVNAISMNLDVHSGVQKPIVGQDCTDCGMCLEVCFGANDDLIPSMNDINNLISSSRNEIGAFFGNAVNKNLRVNGSSGGIATALLSFLLNEKQIDAAIVVRNVPNQPGLAESYLARNSKELLASPTSKYCPVVFDRALKQLKDGERYALVGLPCHIFAVDKLMEKNAIQGSMEYRIGLLCGGTPNRYGTKYIIKNQGFSMHNITEFVYRGEGWPGRMLVKTEKTEVKLLYLDYWPKMSPWFNLTRCIVCLSSFNPRADISIGDYWTPNFLCRDKFGTSLIIARSEVGKNLISTAESKDYVKIEQMDTKSILGSQKFLMQDLMLKQVHIEKAKKRQVFGSRTSNQIEHIRHSSNHIQNIILRVGRFLASDQRRWRLLKFYTALIQIIY